MSCFICLEENDQLYKPDCVCKTMVFHRLCMIEWSRKVANVFECSVCKTDMSPSFLSSFVPLKRLERLLESDPVQKAKYKLVWIVKPSMWVFVDTIHNIQNGYYGNLP